ncbi:hypothetical protein ABTK44_19690, partial [Acinetobacter baumannii]
MFKPTERLIVYVGDVFGPEQTDVTAFTGSGGAPLASVADANEPAHFRNLLDVVVDVNATKKFRVLLNGDWGTEGGLPDAVGSGSHAAA